MMGGGGGGGGGGILSFFCSSHNFAGLVELHNYFIFSYFLEPQSR